MTQHNFARRVHPDLTAIRAIWAAWVFAYHVGLQTGAGHDGFFGRLLAHGYLGVDGFFVLSGMVLTLAHPDLPGHAAPAFWLRRLRRIYPVHGTVLLLLLTMLVAGGAVGVVPNEPERFSAREFWLHAALLQGWGLSGRWAWNYPSWSISTEWAGYIAFPALVYAAGRAPGWVRDLAPALLLCALVCIDAGPGIGLNLTFSGALPRFFPEFCVGILIASRAVPVAPAVPGLVWLGFAALVCGAGGPDAAVVALCAAAMGALLHRGQLGHSAELPGLPALGVRSYAFYMSFATVEIVLAAASRRLGTAPPDNPVLYLVAITLLTAAMAEALHRWVERPWRSRRARDIEAATIAERA